MTARHLPMLAGQGGLGGRVAVLLGGHVQEVREAADEVTIVVARESLVESLLSLRDAPEFAFEQLMDISGVDYPERAERFDVNYHLLSLRHNLRVRVKVSTDEETPVPSVVSLFPNAGWYERETYDCFGVFFEGNRDLRRILTDYGFEGYPFRKDFPLTGHVELRYSEEEQRVVYEPVKLKQDFRSFDFLSPWEGMLPGDEKAGS
jgi:NADH-quinone oxidoreductase subunit C